MSIHNIETNTSSKEIAVTSLAENFEQMSEQFIFRSRKQERMTIEDICLYNSKVAFENNLEEVA